LASLLKLGCVFAGIVVLLSRGWNLGLVLVLASLAVGLLFARPIPLLAGDLIAGTVNILTLRLALAVVLIMTLGELMRRTAALQHMVEALQSLIPGGRIVIASLPSLIGLLPMIGGAMFSAPLVNEVGKRLDATSELKTFINYWFRHMWEPVFPLYPSMLLAAELLNLSPLQLAGTTWPLTVAFLAGGFVFGLRKLPASNPHAIHFDRRSLRLLIRSIWPIVLVIVLSLTLPVDERFGLVVSLLIVITLLTITQHVSPASLVEILYRHVLESSGAVVSVAQALVDLHMPVILVAFIAPFIPGLLTGLMAAAYSIGFPLVLPLVITNGSGIACSWAAWLLAGGVLGTMVSPLHLCLALTRAYFSARWGAIYRLVIPSALLVMLAAAGMLLLTK
jgi:integral membrane protein (TIGR00529 family)